MNLPRESGILLHPTSLPGPYGMGEVGPEAFAFVDALKEMGQSLWQVLPIGPTSYGDSPYQSLSTFAGNHLLISFEGLYQDGLLSKRQFEDLPQFPAERIKYGEVIPARMRVLQAVCGSFARLASREMNDEFETFCDANRDWLDDYALYVAIKESYDLRPFTDWDPELIHREPDALKRVRRTRKTAIRNVKIMQFLFEHQWRRLVGYCHGNGIRLVGDIPIFVAHDSADVWAHPDLYFLEENGQPTVIAGVPPDYFSASGQRWGNPLYDWDVHARDGYSWWKRRLRRAFEWVDVVRIDHFRGFEAYWEIPASEETAIHGRWVKGPGHPFFEELTREFGDLPILAEDLGIITDEVEVLRDRFNLPGMRVLHFAFGNDPKADDYRPESFPTNCVCYTGTHDNNTSVGWFWGDGGEDSTRSPEEVEAERREILNYLHTDGSQISWDLIGLGMRCNANMFIAPLQDVLALGSEHRMNVPGVPSGNWQWRFSWDQLTPDIRQRLRDCVDATGRSRVHA